MPILESTDLFKRTIGEVTDIVEKEMYSFMTRGDENVSMRPEGTAGCVRAGIEGNFNNSHIAIFKTIKSKLAILSLSQFGVFP